MSVGLQVQRYGDWGDVIYTVSIFFTNFLYSQTILWVPYTASNINKLKKLLLE